MEITRARFRLWLAAVAACCCIAPLKAQVRYVDPALDAANLPLGASIYDVGGTDAQIIWFRNWAKLHPAREIHAGKYTLPLFRNEQDFSTLRYNVDGQLFSIDDFMLHNHVAGLLVLKGDEILFERYGLGNNEDSLWVSFSMAKSVTSLLVGAAMRDGYIQGVNDQVTSYLPQLQSTAYQNVSLHNLLQMSSGADWNEDYADPNSDIGIYPKYNETELIAYLAAKPRVAVPGTRYNYNTAEADLSGLVLRSAIGDTLSEYLEQKIWQPFGMEADANWATHGDGGGERGGCCMNATLRDYGRLGLFALRSGELADGTKVLADNWMSAATTAAATNSSYGYLWRLNGGGIFRASGIFGQQIYIDPATDLVVVTLAAWPHATDTDLYNHREAVAVAFDDALRDWQSTQRLPVPAVDRSAQSSSSPQYDIRIYAGVIRASDGSFSDNATVGDSISLPAIVQPEKSQYGQSARVLVVVYQVNTQKYFWLSPTGPVDFLPQPVVTFRTVPKLEENNYLEILRDLPLTENLIGDYRFFIGYQVGESAEIFYTADHVKFSVVSP